MTAKRALILGLTAMLAGCAKEPPPPPPVKISITAADFCQIMKRVAGPTGKLTWATRDTPETITGIRRLGSAYDKRCARLTQAES